MKLRVHYGSAMKAFLFQFRRFISMNASRAGADMLEKKHGKNISGYRRWKAYTNVFNYTERPMDWLPDWMMDQIFGTMSPEQAGSIVGYQLDIGRVR